MRYLTQYRLLVCLEHRRGIPRCGVSNHLRKYHGTKGTELKAALLEVEQLQPLPLIATEHPTVAHGSLRIPEIEAVNAYHCVLERCNYEPELLSKDRRTVERHQARVHGVNHGRKLGGRTRQGTSTTYYKINSVLIQTLLPQPFKRWFIVKDNVDQPRRLSETQPSAAGLAQFDVDLKTAKQEDCSLYDHVPEQTTQAQLPP